MKVRSIALSLAVTLVMLFTAVTASAQSGRGGREDNDAAALAARVAALESAVAKLQGAQTEADLVGTYSVGIFEVDLFDASSTQPPQIDVVSFVGTVTLAADGTGSLNLSAHGSGLQLNPPFVRADEGQAVIPLTWTYAPGTLTIAAPRPESFSVTAGGQVLFAVLLDGRSTGIQRTSLAILTRLP
jgi:hypothetical protein